MKFKKMLLVILLIFIILVMFYNLIINNLKIVDVEIAEEYQNCGLITLEILGTKQNYYYEF